MYYIMLSSELVGFTNRTTEIVKTVSNREMYLLKGEQTGIYVIIEGFFEDRREQKLCE